MPVAHLECLVEPFKESSPGPHVHAVVTAISNAGLEPDMGPFATSAIGDPAALAKAVHDAIVSGIREGASALLFRIEVADG